MKKMFLILLCLGLAGCAPTIRFLVTVDSINNNEATLGKTCIISPGMKDVSPDDLQFKEFSAYVKRALILKGYNVSDDINTADINVFLGYGISEPKEHAFSYSTPIWGQTGVSAASTFGTVSSGFVSATTTYTPSYGVVGSSMHSGTFVTYTRQISLDAYDLKAYRETKKQIELWKTEIISTGSSGDLRFMFPILLGAATKYIGENPGQQVRLILKADSKEVLAIKGISTQ